MTATPGGELPEDRARFNSLARIATDPSTSPEQRNAAMTELEPPITRWARQVASHFSEPVRQSLLDDAFSHVWERLGQFAAERGSPRSWCCSVLYNRGVDMCRRRRPAVSLDSLCESECGEFGGFDPEASMARPEAACMARDEYGKVRQQRRGVLDQWSRQWRAPGEVHYPAVLLMRLRLALAASVAEELPGDYHVAPVERRSQLVAWCLPWRDQERDWAFRAEWPSLAEIWQQVSLRIDDPPYFLDDESFCELVSEILEKSFSTDAWQQWGRRAKKQARGAIGKEKWNYLFGGLLPDRRR